MFDKIQKKHIFFKITTVNKEPLLATSESNGLVVSMFSSLLNGVVFGSISESVAVVVSDGGVVVQGRNSLNQLNRLKMAENR